MWLLWTMTSLIAVAPPPESEVESVPVSPPPSVPEETSPEPNEGSEVTSTPVTDPANPSVGAPTEPEGTPDSDDVELPMRPMFLPDGEALRPMVPLLERDLVAPRSHPMGHGGATVGISELGEDVFFELNVGYVFQLGDWRIAPRLPLRLRIIDNAPEQAEVVRMEDWDEPSDWARLLAFVQYGRVGDPIVFRYGELSAVTLGHGAIVDRTFNTIDIDHYRGGVYFAGDAGFVGGEVYLDDVFHPEVLVGRAFLRPLMPLKDAPLPVRGLKIAVTVGADFSAPTAVDLGEGGLFATPEHYPRVLGDRVLPMFGFDLEFPVVGAPHVDVVPYVDFATLEFDTLGLHVGVMTNVRFSGESSLHTRLEYRFIGRDHEPGYISPFYAVERYSFRGGQPKLAALDDNDDLLGASYHGVHLEADLRIAGILQWAFAFASSGRDRANDLMTRLKFPNLGPVRLTLFLARLGFSGADDLFMADRTTAGIGVHVRIGDLFFVRGRVANEWWLEHSETRTHYETTFNWDVGGGLVIRL